MSFAACRMYRYRADRGNLVRRKVGLRWHTPASTDLADVLALAV